MSPNDPDDLYMLENQVLAPFLHQLSTDVWKLFCHSPSQNFLSLFFRDKDGRTCLRQLRVDKIQTYRTCLRRRETPDLPLRDVIDLFHSEQYPGIPEQGNRDVISWMSCSIPVYQRR